MSFLLQKENFQTDVIEQQKAKNQKSSEVEKNFWQQNLSQLSERIVIGQTQDSASAEVMEEQIENGDGGTSKQSDEENIQAAATSQIAPSKSILKHDSKLFRLSCPCSDCLKHRETVIQLFLEDFEYNTLWERLQLLIRKFYDLIPEDPQSNMDKKYRELMSRNLTKWLSDGRIDTKKNIQISLGSNLPLSNEMTFILVFSMLYSRDPHQFFELLCIQISSIMKAYCEGLTGIISVDEAIEYDPTVLLNFIMDGYDKVCSSAEQLAPLLFELQRGHLQKFSLSWALLNKRMYQRCVYFEVLKLIPECILKLKKLVIVEKFKAMVQRFTKFDEEMSTITEQWKDIWNSLLEYHKSTADMARRRRISSAHSIMLAIKQSEFRFDDSLISGAEERNIVDWIQSEKREEVWQYCVYHLQKKWHECTNPRLSANICNLRCNKCNKSIGIHYIECQCRTCLIAGGPSPRKSKRDPQQVYCAKCSFLESMQNVKKDITEQKAMMLNGVIDENKNATTAVVSSTSNKSKKRGFDEVAGNVACTMALEKKGEHHVRGNVYHLAWAVFKHLPDRVPYSASAIEPDVFCIFQPSPCTANSCRVATNIIAALYPLNFSKFLLKTYRPLSDDERKKLVTIQNFDFKNLLQKFCDDINKTTENKINADKLHPLHFMDFLLWDSDDSESALLSDVASGFAECYLIDFQFPQKHVIFPYFLKLFRVNGKDIEIDMEWLENISNSKITSFDSEDDDDEGEILITKKLKKCDIKIEDIENKMDQLSLNISKSLEQQQQQKQKLQQCQQHQSGGVTDATCAEEVRKDISAAGNTSSTFTTIISAGGATSVTTTSVTDVSDKPTTTAKCNIIEKEIKKPLVEAFKLAASNKKLEAELKSLQKEHSMLKDMITDLEQIHDEMHTHTCTSSSSPSICSSSTSSTCSSASDGGKVGMANKPVNNSNVTQQSAANPLPTVPPTKQSANAQATGGVAKTAAANAVQNSEKDQQKASSDKSSHRTEGQCICYYCTIFGQNDCSHNNRVNETRDRLRKRLHQLQSSKEATAKPISLKKNIKTMKEYPQLTKTTSTTTISTTTTTSTTNSPANSTQKQLQPQTKTSNLSPNQAEIMHKMKNLKINSMKITATKSSIGTNTAATISSSNGINTNITTTTTMTGNRKITINKIIQQTQAPPPSKLLQHPGKIIPQPTQIKIQQQQTILRQQQQQQQTRPNEPIIARPKKEVIGIAQSAAEKIDPRPKNLQELSAINRQQVQQLKNLQEAREKQQLQQQQQQQLVHQQQQQQKQKPNSPPVPGTWEIDDLLKFIEGSEDEDEDKSVERKETKRELKKKLKLNRKERKKLDQLQEIYMHFELIRHQESEAQKEVNLLKNANRKKDKQKFLVASENLKRLRENILELEDKMDELQQSIKEMNPNFEMTLNKPPTTPPSIQQQQQQQSQQLHPQYNNKSVGKMQQQQPPDSLVNQISVDPAKRLVTIKRIELPNSEPQVTVTAKGTSPDKDQLLGTFVNGQLIPPNVTVFHQQQTLAPGETATSKKNKKGKIVAEPPPVKLSEKQLKVARKQAAKLEQLAPPKNKMGAEQKGQPSSKQEVAKAGKKGTIVVDSKTSNKENEPKNKKVKPLTRQESDESTCAGKSSLVVVPAVVEDNKKSKKKQKKGSEVVEQEVVEKSSKSSAKTGSEDKPSTIAGKKKNNIKKSDETDSEHVSTGTCTPVPSEQSSKPSRKKSVPFIDPEFDNNKFKLLDIDGYTSESDNSMVIENGSEQEPEEVEVEELVPPPKPIVTKATKGKTSEPAAQPTKGKKQEAGIASTKGNLGNQRKNSNETTKKVRTPTPPPVEVKLTKKEKKLLAKQQKELEEQQVAAAALSGAATSKVKGAQKQQSKSNAGQQKQPATSAKNVPVSKAVSGKGVTAKQFANFKDKMHLNAETTLEVVKQNNGNVNKIQQGNGVSIMEQLSRGIKVEGLTLPPGITLTRVDSQTADAIRAKKESIQRLSQPMQSQNEYHQPKVDPTMIMAHPMAGIQPNPNGIIMVDTKNINATISDGKTTNKKNKKKNKNKNAIDPQMVINKNTNLKKLDNQKGNHGQQPQQQGKKGACSLNQQQQQHKNKTDQQHASQMITLRNPMFNDGATKTQPQLPIGSNRPPGMNASLTGYDQPAAIIKNDNGMFTIRNPALHQALSQAVPGVIGQVPVVPTSIGPTPSSNLHQLRQMNPNMYSSTAASVGGNLTNDNMVVGDNYSYFSASQLDNSTSTTNSYTSEMRRCNSAIGSEMKQQQKQQFYQQQQQQQPQMGSWNPNPSLASGIMPMQNGGASGGGSGSGGGGNDLYGLQQQLKRQSARCYSPFEQYGGGTFTNDFVVNQSSMGVGYGQQTNNSPGAVQPSPNMYSNLGVNANKSSSLMNSMGGASSNLSGTYNDYSAFANARTSTSSIPTHLHNGNGNSGNLFDNSTSHVCDDSLSSGRISLYGSVGSSSPGSAKGGMDNSVGAVGGSGIGGFSNLSSYDDYSFLQNLQPGQKLNNEVTIHNINESKFIRNQTQQIPDDIEITKITGPRNQNYFPMSSSAHLDFDENVMSEKFNNSMCLNDARIVSGELGIGSSSSSSSSILKPKVGIREFGESVFAPNQQVSLAELDLEERDIETFKRFDYYFDPPKNKPKVNINVKDIVVNNSGAAVFKKPRPQNQNPSESPSSFGEMSSSFSSNCDELYVEGDVATSGNGGPGILCSGSASDFVMNLRGNDLQIGNSE